MELALIKYNADYADEFNVYGFGIMPIKLFNEKMAKIRTIKGVFPFEFCFGSNECVLHEDYADFVSSISVEAISAEMADRLILLFNMRTYNGIAEYGHFPSIDEYLEDIEENEDA